MGKRVALVNIDRSIFLNRWLERTAESALNAASDFRKREAPLQEVSRHAREILTHETPLDTLFTPEFLKVLRETEYEMFAVSTLPSAVVSPLIVERYGFSKLFTDEPPIQNGSYIFDGYADPQPDKKVVIKHLMASLKKAGYSVLTFGQTAADFDMMSESMYRVAYNPAKALKERLRERYRRQEERPVGVISEYEGDLEIKAFALGRRDRAVLTERDPREFLPNDVGERLHQRLGESTNPLFPTQSPQPL